MVARPSKKFVVDCPDLLAQWHPTRNADLTPDKVGAGSAKKIWWKCDKGHDHEWEKGVVKRSSGTGCPFCAGFKVSVTNSLATLFPDVAVQWHPTRNGNVKPENVIAGAEKKYWWKCPEGPDHEWPARCSSRTYGKAGCPFCAGKRLSVTNSITALFANIAAQWHPTKNGTLTPDKVLAGSNEKHWWKCPEGEDHEWAVPVNNRTYRNTGCPFCGGVKVSVTNSLATLFPKIAAQWHPTKNGTLTPDRILASSERVCWWKCPYGPDHEWPVRCDVRTMLNSNCPFCILRPRSRREIFLAFELLHFFQFDIDAHKVPTAGRVRDVDIIIDSHRLIVEYDGSYWHKGDEDRDHKKNEYLEEQGWRVLRVRELPLEPILPSDIQIAPTAPLKTLANRVLDRIATNFNIPIPGLVEYKKRHSLINAKAAEEYIESLLMKQTPDGQMSLNLAGK